MVNCKDCSNHRCMYMGMNDTKKCGDFIKRGKEKPVAWLVEFENGEQELHFEEQSAGETHTPLYTTPPAAPVQEPDHIPDATKMVAAQRPWVGLTQQEVQEIHDTYYRRMGPQEFALMLEQRLKEKNT